MTAPFEHATEVRDALHAIADDPALGRESLDNAQTAANLLRDLLPDAPRETSLLMAAITAGAPALLREHMAQGMAGDTYPLRAGGVARRAGGVGAVGALSMLARRPRTEPAPPNGCTTCSANPSRWPGSAAFCISSASRHLARRCTAGFR